MAARRRARCAADAGRMSRADFRALLLATDFFGIPWPLGGFRRAGADDPCDLGVLRRSIGPGDDEHNAAVTGVRCGGHVPIFARAVFAIVLLDVKLVAILVRKNEGGIIKRDTV